MAYAKKGMLDEMISLAKRLVSKGLVAEIIEEYRDHGRVELASGDVLTVHPPAEPAGVLQHVPDRAGRIAQLQQPCP